MNIEAVPPPLRARRRAELRQQLSDTATALFLERGFEDVTVADVARACGVTEKTVFNHFPKKEELLVDRWPDLIAQVSEQLGDPSRSPLSAVLEVLDRELEELTDHGAASARHMNALRRFGALIGATPALLDHRRRAFDQLIEITHAALAARADVTPADSELRITAVALTGLFQVFYRSLAANVQDEHVATCRRRVRADVRRAARLLRIGLDGGAREARPKDGSRRDPG
jgi:AcrR family transcriptional regulator